MASDLDLLSFDVFEDEFMVCSDTDEEARDSNSGPAPKTCKVASKILLKKGEVHIASLLKQVDGECITEGVVQILSG